MLTFAQFQKLQEDKMLPIKKVPTLLPQIPNVVDRHRAARAKWQGELRHAAKVAAAKRLAANARAGKKVQ
jgi:hypothetical protein